MLKKLSVLFLLLAVGLSACSFNFSLPIFEDFEPVMEDEISLPIPAGSEQLEVELAFGAGNLNLHPGTDQLVEGTARYNLEDLKPVVSMEETRLRIEQGEWHVDSIPDLGRLVNEWDLALGNAPMDLTIEAGAYQGEYEFGGLSLTNLRISDGAADVELSFSEPNPVEMGLFQYQTGASNVSLIGLANANFSSLEFDSGAGNFTLDFSGTLSREANVNIETGVSNMTLVIPSGRPVEITVQGGLSNVSYGSGWEKNGNVYTQEGSGPRMVMVVEIGAGNLTITP